MDFNSDITTWYTGTATTGLPGTQFDVQSDALHELTHSLGFSSNVRGNGAGLQNNTPGQPDTYTQLDRFLRRLPPTPRR